MVGNTLAISSKSDFSATNTTKTLDRLPLVLQSIRLESIGLLEDIDLHEFKRIKVIPLAPKISKKFNASLTSFLPCK